MNKFSTLQRIPWRCLSISRLDKAVCWPKPDYGPVEVQRSVLMNGIRVAAAKPLGAQMGSCTIMYQAGSRYEVDDFIGANHFLRASSSTSGLSFSGFAKMRYLPQNGGFITCSSDRQTIAYTLRCPTSSFTDLKCVLLDTAVRGSYHQYEIDLLKPLIHDDHIRLNPEQRVIDLVQQACWAGPLANSVFCPPARIDDMDQNTLQCYVKDTYKTNGCTVASVGIPFEETLNFAESIEFRRERPQERCELKSSPRGAIELHDLGVNSDTWIAVAVPGCGTSDISCLLKHAIIAAACGTGNMQVGQHGMDRTPQLPIGLMAGDDVYTEYKTFNISYKETGVFGILAKTRSTTARHVALAAAEFLSNVGDLDFKQIEIGKKRLKLSLALHDEDCVRLTEGLALQLASNVQIDSAKNSINMVDLMCLDEISCAAKALSGKRDQMAIALVGDVSRVPHDFEQVCRQS